MRIGFAAAGSGGHVYPALAVADAMVASGMDHSDIVFFGGDRMEATTIPAAGFRFVQVDIHGLRRSLSVENLSLPFKITAASKIIGAEIRSAGLDAMIVFGGYVSGPAAQAARRTKIPLIVHEANAVPGIANRLIASRASLVLVASVAATSKLKTGVVVGNPLRRAFDTFDRSSMTAESKGRYGIPLNAKVLGIVGGSLGSGALNAIAVEIASHNPRSFHILHIAGTPHAGALLEASASYDDWTVLPYEEDMIHLYAACDLVVSRAGAMTIAELEETATPAIVVPLPAGKGYQTHNADELQISGGAVVISQDDTEAVVAAVFSLMADDAARGEMGRRAGQTGRRNAATEVANRTMELAHG